MGKHTHDAASDGDNNDDNDDDNNDDNDDDNNQISLLQSSKQKRM